MDANSQGAQLRLKLDGKGFSQRTFNDREISTWLTLGERSLIKERLDPLKNRTNRGLGSEPRNTELAGLLAGHTKFTKENHDFMKGTVNNGAFRTPDLDAESDATNAYGVFVRIPDEAYIILSENCDLLYNNRVVKNVPVQEITPEQYNMFIYDSYKNPSFDLVWALNNGSFTLAGTSGSETSAKFDTNDSITGFTGVSIDDNTTSVTIDTYRSRHLIAGKDFTVSGYTVHYIKLPREIIVNLRQPTLQQSSELPEYMHDEVIDRALEIAVKSLIPAEQRYQLEDKTVKEDQ